jgi:protein-S-isoprenylcysteine O-methyltransferase Ste14
MKPFLQKHGWTIFNLYLFVNFAIWCGWETWKIWSENRLGYVEAAFIIQNVVFLAVVLLRPKHRALDTKIWHQLVALAAFLSGMLFVAQGATGGGTTELVSKGITVAANLLGIVTLLNLGKSFGILIACRQIKSDGLYGIVRHPMYGTDILLRIGFLVGHFSGYTVTLFVLSTGCYVWRAMLEEKFLASVAPEYVEYKQRVRWRFIPGIF